MRDVDLEDYSVFASNGKQKLEHFHQESLKVAVKLGT